MNQRKSLKELNLLDKFLFDEAMDDPENVKTMLDIILSQKTKLKHPPQTEKEQRTSTDNRQIRLDVYAIDEDDVIYEVEAQKENTHNLPKRSRLYQGVIDSKLLPPGVVDFNLLNEVLIVLIMPFDLFGYGLYRYTFYMRCEEVPELKLNDGATRIFLNTRGKHPELVSPELIELLKYMERSTDEVSRECKSKRIQEMHRRVCQIKASEKAEVKYMQTWEEKILIKQAGIAEGEQIGRSKEKTEFVKKLSNKFSIEQIAEMLEIDISEVEKIIKEIADLLDKKPYELSGGEKQRTAICRALIYNPDLILADEPTGNLDSASSEVVIHTLEEINKKMGKTILLVTHDPIIASSCDRIIFLKDGKVKEDLKRTGDKEQFYNEIITNWC